MRSSLLEDAYCRKHNIGKFKKFVEPFPFTVRETVVKLSPTLKTSTKPPFTLVPTLKTSTKPPPVTEFEIQAIVYTKLKASFQNHENVIVRGEYTLRSNRGQCVRADIILLNKKCKPLLVVEVKRSDNKCTKQAEVYLRVFGLRCVYVRSISDAERILELIELACTQYNIKLL